MQARLSNSPSSPFAHSTCTSGTCKRYRFLGTDSKKQHDKKLLLRNKQTNKGPSLTLFLVTYTNGIVSVRRPCDCAKIPRWACPPSSSPPFSHARSVSARGAFCQPRAATANNQRDTACSCNLPMGIFIRSIMWPAGRAIIDPAVRVALASRLCTPSSPCR